MNFLTSLFVLSALCVVSIFGGEIITSPPVTNHGQWTLFQKCPEGTWAKGFQLLTQYNQGIFVDDTSLNGVKFFCGYPTDTETVNITSGFGVHGDWGRSFSCGSGWIYGFQLRVAADGAATDDDTATANVRAFCTNAASPEIFIEGDGTVWGEWRDDDVLKCPAGQAICGLQTQIQPDFGALVDNTAMNNMAAECCDLPQPTTTTRATTTTTTAPLLKIL